LILRYIVFFLLFALTANSQTPQLNLEKYWYYRNRLKNDFMIPGEGQGYNLIANERNYGQQGILYFGDVTINVGWHLAVLASEYRLLKNNNQPVDSTLKEIYLALQAFNRLDETAETYFTNPISQKRGTSQLNGFFIRDDVKPDFFSDPQVLAHFNQQKTSSSKVSRVYSDFASTNITDKEMSHDQIWHVLMGLALIQELVDSKEYYKNLNVVTESQNITVRLLSYLDSGKWKLYNPVTGKLVGRGKNAKLLKHGVLKATRGILKNDFSESAFMNLWDFLQFMPVCPIEVFNKDLCKEYSKVLVLAAVGNSWNGIFKNNTDNKISYLSKLKSYEHIPLLHAVLHGGKNKFIADSKYEELINTAPYFGPFNYGKSEEIPYEWSANNRFIHPERRGYTIKDHELFPGEYNGLDYMLLYNLYAIVKGNKEYCYFPFEKLKKPKTELAEN